MKSVTTLGPCPPDELLLLDLETVELDVAALEHGYRRPDGLGHPIDVTVAPRRRSVASVLAGLPRTLDAGLGRRR